MRRRMMMNGGLKSVITINQTISSPYSRVSGDVNGTAIQWIRENSHRYLGKYKDGVMYICQLDDSNSNYYHDGTQAILTGAEGDVFMRMPKFYYCGTEGDIVDITFSTVPFDNCVPWMDNALIGVYEMYVTNNKGYSRSGNLSTNYMSQPTAKSYASSRGTGFQIQDWQMRNIVGCLYFAIYGNTDSQGTVGSGAYENDQINGQTNSLGMTDTVAGGNGDGKSINFWGLEKWWGNNYEWIHDFRFPAGTSNATVSDPINGGTRSLSMFSWGGGCPMKLKFGRYLDLIVTPDSSSTSYTKGYCCYQKWSSSASSNGNVAGTSGCGSLDWCGNAIFFGNDSSSISGRLNSSRLAFRGSIVEMKDVQTFKSIAATN